MATTAVYVTGADESDTEGSAPRLDSATNFTGGWLVTEHEGCSEISVLPLMDHSDREYVAPGEGEDQERAAREACRRAAATLRRYCVRHMLNRLWTLTFAEEPASEAEAWRQLDRFRKRLARKLGQRIPLAVSLERGSKNGRLHFHMAAGQYLDKELIAHVWALGFVDGRKIRAGGTGARERARRAAAYLAKYVSKEQTLEPGTHRYSTTRGMAPRRRSLVAARLDLAVRWAHERLAADGSTVTPWCSSSSDDWQGPPVWLFFGEDP